MKPVTAAAMLAVLWSWTSSCTAEVRVRAPALVVVDVPREERVVVREVVVAPPALKVEVFGTPPSPAHIWVTGHWVRVGNAWEWSPGYWVKAAPGKKWISGHWEGRGAAWIWVGGRWQ